MKRYLSFLYFALFCMALSAQGQRQQYERDKIWNKFTKAINDGRKPDASALCDEYLAVCNSENSRYDMHYAEIKHFKAKEAATEGDYSKAQKIMDEVINALLDKRVKHPSLEHIGDAFFERGEYHFRLGNKDKAISDMQAAAEAYRKSNEKGNYAAALCQMAHYCNLRGAPGDAEKKARCYQEAFGKAEKGTRCYFSAAAWRVHEYIESGETRKADKLLQKMAKEGEKKHPVPYADFLYLVSEYEASARNYRDALTYANKASAIYEKEGKTNSRNYACLLKNAGDCHFNLQEFERALLYYVQTEPILLKYDGVGGKIYEACKRQINACNVWLGKVDLVQNYQQELENQINTASDTTTFVFARKLEELAKGKAGMGIYKEAVVWGERALRRFEALGESQGQIQMLYALSNYYLKLDEFQRAEEYNELTLKKCHAGHFFEEEANALHQKAKMLCKKRQYEQADEVCSQALALLRKSNMSNSTTYASTLGTRAYIQDNLKGYETAVNLTREALKLQTKILGPKHGNNVVLLFNLAIYNHKLGQMDSVAYYYHNAIELQTELVRNNFSFQSTVQREYYWQQKNYLYQTAPLFASIPEKAPASLLTDIYNAQLFTKGILLNSEAEFRRILQRSGDEEVLGQYNEWQMKCKELQKYYDTQTGNERGNIKQLQDQIKRLEFNIVRKCKEFGDFTQNLKLNSDSVRRALQPHEAAVEFIESDVTLNDKPDHIYLALILRPEWDAPHACQLFFRSDVEKLGYPVGTPLSILLTKKDYQNKIYDDGRLGQLVWGELVKNLDGATDIYFAPSGVFHQWGIEYMPYDSVSGTRISDTLSVYRLSSTKLLAQRTDTSKTLGDGEAVIYGGLEYENMSIAQMREYHDMKSYDVEDDEDYVLALSVEQEMADSVAIYAMAERGTSVRNLPATKKEVDDIDRLFYDAGKKCQMYEGFYGTEESFKQLSGRSISLLHIAAHGFSYSILERDNPELDWLSPSASSIRSTDPLSYSGLLFSGCNNKLQSPSSFPSDIEDGILTAQEIAQLNLHDLQLTVLSACQTGLGVLREDGVFGVQRGFKKAGAHTLVMSLWSVNDAATQRMMTSFYEALFRGLSRHDAFLEAQKAVREEYPEPHFWAPFIMLDDI